MRRRDFLKSTTVAAGVSLLEACGGQEEQYLIQPAVRPDQFPGVGAWRLGVCQQCSAGCGVQVRVVDGNAKKIEGNPQHPVNRGGVCALGQSLLQELYNPDRMLEPRRRNGERGAGGFDAISWEEALAEVVGAIASTPADRVAILGSRGSSLVGALWQRLAAALGASPPAFLEAPELEVERRAAAITLGIDDVPYFDLSRSDYVLSIGASFLDRWRSPVHYTRMLAEMRQGRSGRRGKLVHAEARMSLTAANADEWLPLRPGTEGLLARGIAGVMVSEGLVEGVAIERYRRLFPDAPPSLDEVSEGCDLPASKIARIAEELALAESRVVMAGGSAAAHSNGLFNLVAALGLNVLLDSLGRQGGLFAPASLGLDRGLAPEGAGTTSIVQLVSRLGVDSPREIDLLIVAEADPLHTLPRGWRVEEALSEVDKIIVLSSFLDDTAMVADLLLPVHTELERFNAVEPVAAVGVPVLSLARPAVEPLGEGHHPADLILALAASLGESVSIDFPWPSYAALVETRVEEELGRLTDGTEAARSGYFSAAISRGGIFGDGAPQVTPPGPAGPAPSAAAPQFDGADSEFPFVLVPFESIKMGDGRGANRPWLQELPDPLSTVMWDSWVELSPADAAALAVRDGDRLRIESPSGSVEALAVVDPAVRPGVVGMPLGQGYRDYGRYARERGTNPMDLVGALRVAGTDAPAWAATRVRLERLAPGRLVRFGRSHSDRGESERIPVGWAPPPEGRETLG